mmetsp:Transcript_71770/g.134222  ORF Transcript_71770/g.134222 Transcript_71770/m.134222 type:complete len:219 (-) Transcript_71770:75-731(-)
MLGALKQLASFPLEVFGSVGHYEAYSYSVVKDYGTWTIRRYAPAVAAQVQQGGGDDSSFMTLAAYIGVLGDPQNKGSPGAGGSEAVAMTVPVVSSTPINMTVPVVNAGKNDIMQFILPSEYQRAADAPVPMNPAVTLLDVPARYTAALQWHGMCRSMEDAAPQYAELEGMMAEVGLKPAGPFELHRFNPPYTLPPFRTNEIVVPLAEDKLVAAGIPLA